MRLHRRRPTEQEGAGSQPRRRVGRRHLLLAVALLPVVVLGLRWWPTIHALQDSRAQVAAARRAIDHLQKSPQVTGLDEVERRLRLAAEDLGPRSRFLDDAPETRFLAGLPWVGGQVRAARALRHSGQHAVAAAQLVLPLAHSALSRTGPLDTILAGIDDPLVGGMQRELAALRQSLAQARSARLAWPFGGAQQRALKHGTDLAGLLGQALDGARILHATLGSGDHRYLVLLGNPAEIRPGGGFTGVLGLLETHDGHIVSTAFRDAYFRPSKVTDLQAPRPLDQHLFAGRPWQITDANWSADFPTSAADYARFYLGETGVAVDGVLGLSTSTFSDLLRITGTVTVPGFTQVINPKDVVRQLSAIANRVNPGDPGKSYLVGFGHEMVQRLLHTPISKARAVARALGKGARQRDLLVWLRDPLVADLLPAEIQGRIVPTTGADQLLVTDANISGAKNDLFVVRSAALTVTQSASAAVHVLTLSYYQPPPVTKEDRGLLDNSSRGYRDYIEVRVPLGATLAGMQLTDSSGTHAVGPELIDTDHGLTRFGYFLLVPLGGHATVEFDYTTTGPFTQFEWDKQSQALPHAITLDVTWVDGRRTHVSHPLSEPFNVRR